MIELIDKHGTILAKGTIVPDGGRLRVPALMMDGASPDIEAITRKALADAERPQAAFHKPSPAVLSDADLDAREKSRDARKATLGDAWRNPPAADADPAHTPEVKAPQSLANKTAGAPGQELETFHAKRLKTLENAWSK